MSDMDEERFEELMRQAGTGYRPAPEPRIEPMWQVIEARSFGSRLAPRWRIRWNGPLSLAAMLLLGLGVGWIAGRSGAPAAVPDGTVAATADRASVPVTQAGNSPFVGVASNYLTQMTALLIAVAGDIENGRVPRGTIGQARDLLSTTRLLLDSEVSDDRLRNLLEDLELVLAQVVRIPNNGELPETALITQALNEREVLPRLTYYLADNSVAP